MTTASTSSSASNKKLALAQRLLFKSLSQFHRGSLTVLDGDNRFVFGDINSEGPHATAQVINRRVYREMLTGGDLAAAECYVAGFWDTQNLTQVVRVFAANLDITSNLDTKFNGFSRTLLRLAHWLNRNDKKGSRRNISAHYDLGNELFETFLDSSMMYSSAIYPNQNSTLAEAQAFRLDRICQKLNLSEQDHLLEIGTGWGGFAIHAARHYGCRVTTTTISKKQYNYAKQRIQEAGLSDQIELLFEDYRDLTGQYDKLVSIEMIEAVGHRYLPSYFSTLSKRLKATGCALIQCITLPDQRYTAYHKSVDFIRKYIFPGGHLPSLSVMLENTRKHSSMQAVHLEDITEHYARTLHDWHQSFVQAQQRIRDLGYDQQFFRLWRYYLSYCEGGFSERAIRTHQIVFAKAGNRQNWVL